MEVDGVVVVVEEEEEEEEEEEKDALCFVAGDKAACRASNVFTSV